MKKNIAIYNDEGVGEFSLFAVMLYFKKHDPILLSAADIKQGGLSKDIDLFVMPGGADRPYHKHLNGDGNKTIRAYVEDGGTYLGICAGAYYGCADIAFQKGQAHEICETRDLNFFDGMAVGCLPSITSLYDETLNTAAITPIMVGGNDYPALYWGGCRFEGDDAGCEIIGSYKNDNNAPTLAPAIISMDVGTGRAILSGVHFEVTVEALCSFEFQDEKENQRARELAEALQQNKETLGVQMKEYLDV